MHTEQDTLLSSPHHFSSEAHHRGKGTAMIVAIEIENMDELRRCEGIDDVELHEDIGRLRVGDHVRLTFLAGAAFARRCRCTSAAFARANSAADSSARSLGRNCSGFAPTPW